MAFRLDLLPVELQTRLMTLPFQATVFKAVGLTLSYDYMITYMVQKLRSHPEVDRVPALLDLLVEHFVTHADKHIRLSNNAQIFNQNIIGTSGSLRGWQEAGYRTKRSRANYSRRLNYWKSIYDETDLLVRQGKKKRPSQKNVTTRKRRTFLGQYTERMVNLGRVKDRNGDIVTYAHVIELRNAGYGNVVASVPFWIPFNYGTRGVSFVGGGAGYPDVAGAFFIEKGEQRMGENLNKMLALFDQFAVDVLDGKNRGDLAGAVDFITHNARAQNTYIDVVGLGVNLALSEGLF